jgi:[ribosomal protein S5]-alanine N-acetyltransferase
MNSIYEGKKIELAFFDEQFLENNDSNYYDWFYNPLVTKNNSHGLFPYSKTKQRKFFDAINNGEIIVFAIIDKCTQTHIGNVSLQSLNYINRSAEIAIVIGETAFWGKGCGLEACHLTIEHAFNKLGLNRVWSGTLDTNIGMQKVFERLGFVKEGIFKEGSFQNGEFHDIIAYGITRDKKPKPQAASILKLDINDAWDHVDE